MYLAEFFDVLLELLAAGDGAVFDACSNNTASKLTSIKKTKTVLFLGTANDVKM